MEPQAPAEKILFVDDDPNILASFLRQLRKRFNVDTALGAAKAFELLKAQGPYAVIVSDFKMPGMDGVELLGRVREKSPDTVRILLTGYADVDTAIRAVNEGNIFRLLTKPVDLETLGRALVAGIRQHRLHLAERDIMERTLAGSIKLLTELLALLHPEAMGRTDRIRRLTDGIAANLGLAEDWVLNNAVMLSQIGLIIMPPESVHRVYAGLELEEEDSQLFAMHPMVAADLIRNVPRLEDVALVVSLQEKRYDGSGPPPEEIAGEELPIQARVLKVALDYDLLLARTGKVQASLDEMRDRRGWYDPRVLAALAEFAGRGRRPAAAGVVGIDDLTENMILAEDVRALDGRVLLPRGRRVTRLMVRHLQNFRKHTGVREPIKVAIAAEDEEA
ncbi:MAG: HD domain-containing phosphohydrolase [Thermodesulfobacteriota bacterium]